MRHPVLVAVDHGDFDCVKALLEDQDLESRKEIARIFYVRNENALQVSADCRIPILHQMTHAMLHIIRDVCDFMLEKLY